MSSLEIKKHVGYFLKHLEILPTQYSSQDTNRLTILYFCVGALDIMNQLDKITNKKEIIDWIYTLQICPQLENDENEGNSGFVGGNFYGNTFYLENKKMNPLVKSHVTMTYTALAVLKILGDDYSRVKKKSICVGLKSLQQEDGCFLSTRAGGEIDMRFTYSACAASALIDDFSGIDIEKVTKYIVESQRYDGSFPHVEGLEGHGGYSYCAISSLILMKKFDQLKMKNELTEWLTRRQELGGLNGRPHKDQDTCYSFWVGATLKSLDALDFISNEKSIEFTLRCQHDKFGGICKHMGTYPDPLHSFMSISGLSLMNFQGLNEIYAPLGLTKRSLEMK